MTYSTEITLWCDGEECNTWRRFQVKTVTRARTTAEEQGWETTRGGPDYCPDCSNGGEKR